MIRPVLHRGLFTLATASLLACSEPPWPDVTPEPAPPAPPARVDAAASATPDVPAAPVAVVTLAPEALAALAPMMAANDKIHAALAGDTTQGVTEAATTIAEAALAARPLVKDATLQALLADVETRARHLGHGGDIDARRPGGAGLPAGIEAMRLTYGDLSKPLVAIASAVPALRDGRHVFMCPMAKGYQKWLQAEPSLRNPYFGAKMLTCGEESTWAP